MALLDFTAQPHPARVSKLHPTQAKAHPCQADTYKAAKHSTSTTTARNASTNEKPTCADSCPVQDIDFYRLVHNPHRGF